MTSPTSSSSSAQPAHLSEDVITKTNVSRTSRELGTFDRMVDDGDDLDYHGHLKSSRQGDKGFTKNDQKDMKRMGKEQELRRNFRGLSTIAFTVILQGTWEVLLAASYQGMYSGGLAGLFWSYIWTFTGFSLVVVSLAEMASMAPTSGGQVCYSPTHESRTSADFSCSTTGSPNSHLPSTRNFSPTSLVGCRLYHGRQGQLLDLSWLARSYRVWHISTIRSIVRRTGKALFACGPLH